MTLTNFYAWCAEVAQGASRASEVGKHNFAEGVSEANTPAVLQSEAHVHEPLLGWEAGQDSDEAWANQWSASNVARWFCIGK
jgi:hypothetical protein